MDARHPMPPRSLEERVEGVIRTLLGDSTLQPLFVVILGHVVAFLAPVVVLALRDRSVFALAALAIMLVASVSALWRDWQQYRRPGPIGGTLLIVWVLTAGAAGAAAHYGIF